MDSEVFSLWSQNMISSKNSPVFGRAKLAENEQWQLEFYFLNNNDNFTDDHSRTTTNALEIIESDGPAS